MWGQVVQYHKGYQVSGIIPTRVGTSRVTHAIRDGKWDHPHACGDKSVTFPVNSLTTGSSPRVWGQGFSHFLGWILKGIIPTRVGTSVVYPICKHIFEDHPHACGDKMDSGNQPSRERGSSPRVWGQGTNRGCIPCAPGIIPTRVGTR